MARLPPSLRLLHWLSPTLHSTLLSRALSSYLSTWSHSLPTSPSSSSAKPPTDVDGIKRDVESIKSDAKEIAKDASLIASEKIMPQLEEEKLKSRRKTALNFLSSKADLFSLCCTSFLEGFKEGKNEDVDVDRFRRNVEGVVGEVEGWVSERKEGRGRGK